MDINYELEQEFIIVYIKKGEMHIRSLSDGAFQIAYRTLKENKKVKILEVFRRLVTDDLKTICE